MLSILALLGTFLLMPLVAQAQKYTITINQVEHATITAYYIFAGQKTIVKNGDQVSRNKRLRVQATPDEGYVVTHYIINDVEKENLGNEYSEFVTSDLTISARVAPATLHTVTITQPEHGTLKVTDGGKEVTSGDQKYFGTRLSLELTPETGYEIEYWIVNGKKFSPSTKAGFENKGALTVREDVTVTAQLKEAGTKTMVPVTLVKPEHATIKAYKGKYASSSPELAAGEQVEAGSEILVVTTPEAGYGVDYWLFNGQRVEKATYSPNQQTFKILEASTIEPVLKEAGYKITYEQPAEGGTLSVKAGYGSSAQTVVSGSRVEERAFLKIEATVEAGYLFKHFLINGKVKTVTSPSSPYIFETATEDMTIAAVIEKLEPCIVTITPFDHGTLTVKSSRSSAVIKDGEEVPVNTLLSIEAKVDPAYEFKHFLINGVETPHSYYSDFFKTYSCNYMVTGPVTIAVVAVEKPSTVITIDPFEHGELVVKYGMYPNSVEVKSGDAVPQGETISVDAFFDDGYGLDHFLVNGESKPSDDAESDYILLTVGDTPLKLSAVAKKTHGLIVMVQPDAAQGTMAAHYTDNGQQKDLQDSTWVALETPVTFVVTPKEGYEMASWKVNDETKELESADPNQLTLPVNDNIKVEPVLKAKAAPQPTMYTVTLGELSNTKGFFYAFYGEDMTTIQSGASLPAGTEVSFQVDAADGYELDYWMVDDVKSDDTSNPLVITLSKNVKVVPVMKEKAAPQPTDAKITMIQPEHGTLTASYYDDEEYDTFDVIDGGRVNLGVNVTFVVKPNEGYEMDYWMVDDERQELDTETPNETIITVTGDLKIEPILKKKAAPQPTMYTVTLTQPDATQGTMTAHYTNDATKVVTDGMSVAKDTQVTFVVTPKEGYEMDSWKVNIETKPLESADPNQLTLTVTGDLTVQPVMKAKAPVNPTEATLTITREGIGGTVSGKYVTPDEKTFSIWEGNTKQVPLGSTVTLTATITTAGYEVTYTNNGKPVPADALSADGTVYTFTVNGDATVVATFAQKQVTGEFAVKWVAEPEEGGEISASTAEGTISNGDKVAGGTLITVNATAKENFEVDQWFLNGKELEAQKGKESYTFALTENVTIKVTFKSTLPPAEYAVTVESVLPSAEAGTVKLFYKDGSVVASGTKVVTGSEMYVEVKPADKYELETLQVGETKIPAGDEKLVKQADGGFKYAFTVTEATKIQATFKLINAIEQLTAGQVAVYVTNGGTRLEVAGAAEGAEVRLYDYTGQLLLASTEHALDISALPAGSYIVLVGNYTTRIVK